MIVVEEVLLDGEGAEGSHKRSRSLAKQCGLRGDGLGCKSGRYGNGVGGGGSCDDVPIGVSKREWGVGVWQEELGWVVWEDWERWGRGALAGRDGWVGFWHGGRVPVMLGCCSFCC